MINSASVFIFVVFFILTRVYFHIKKPKKYVKRIPGPPVHPLFGNFLTLSSLDPVPYKAWHTLTQTFGPIVRLVLGPTTMVILGGLEEIKEAMNNELLDDRKRPLSTLSIMKEAIIIPLFSVDMLSGAGPQVQLPT